MCIIQGGCLAILVLIILIILVFVIYKIVKFNKQCNKKINKKINKNYEPFEDMSRLEYYMGNVNKPIKYTLKPDDVNSKNMYLLDSDFISERVTNSKMGKDSVYHRYFKEIKEYIRKMKENTFGSETPILFIPGDVKHSSNCMPFVVKTRPINKRGLSVLLPLNNKRHWGPIEMVNDFDIEYDKKKDAVIWRGFATGKGKRIGLVENWHDHDPNEIDIGFTNFLDSYLGKKSTVGK